MSLIDKTEKGQTESVAFEIDLPHPPEKVWRALTEPELLERWLLPVIGLKLEPGAEFTLQAEPQPGWDGTALFCAFIAIGRFVLKPLEPVPA